PLPRFLPGDKSFPGIPPRIHRSDLTAVREANPFLLTSNPSGDIPFLRVPPENECPSALFGGLGKRRSGPPPSARDAQAPCRANNRARGIAPHLRSPLAPFLPIFSRNKASAPIAGDHSRAAETVGGVPLGHSGGKSIRQDFERGEISLGW